MNSLIYIIVAYLPIKKRINIAESTNTVGLLRILANDKSTEVRCVVASNEKTPAETLDILANEESIFKTEHDIFDNSFSNYIFKNNWSIKEHVAYNPNTSEETLLRLASDKNRHVRRCVAHNENISIEALKLLANDNEDYREVEIEWDKENIFGTYLAYRDWGEEITREIVASSVPTIQEIIKLSNDKDELVRISVVQNKNISKEISYILSNDNHPIVRWMLASYTNHQELLIKLAKDQEELVRTGVAENEHTSKDILITLLDDEDEFVREEAKERIEKMNAL